MRRVLLLPHLSSHTGGDVTLCEATVLVGYGVGTLAHTSSTSHTLAHTTELLEAHAHLSLIFTHIDYRTYAACLKALGYSHSTGVCSSTDISCANFLPKGAEFMLFVIGSPYRRWLLLYPRAGGVAGGG